MSGEALLMSVPLSSAAEGVKGTPAAPPGSDALPDMAGGMHVNLHNDLWGTSFSQWWGGDMAFRFRLLLQV